MASHIVILGGGVSGLAAAEACARRGLRVTLIERNGPQRNGCSFGNAGMVVPSHFIPMAAPGVVVQGLKWMLDPESPFYIKPRVDRDLTRWGLLFIKSATAAHVDRCSPVLRDLHLASRALYEELAASEDFGLVRKGLVMLCKEAHTLDEEAKVAETARRLGVPADVLDAAALARLDPGITMDVVGGVHYPKDCHLPPERYLHTLEQRATAHGANLLWNTGVTGLIREGGRIRAVRTHRGEIEADQFALCGGIWSERLVAPLGLRLPMQAGKGYSVTVPHPVQLPQLCSILTEARVAVTPMDGTLRFGGTMEISGLNEQISQRRVEGILHAATRYFPAFERSHFDGIEPWHGMRPCPPDGMPFLGRTAAASNLIVATGHAMMGLSLAPVTGRIVADLATDTPTDIDLTLLSPDRFA